ncbi:MAG TPA: PIN domain-containing protein [Caulobacteraceae bacterium]|nr:PIN domain-containing protein [Caulobacteraceae bacterium]
MYTQDLRYPSKQSAAVEWLNRLLISQRMSVSAQVLNETYWVVSRKAEFGHWRADVRTFLGKLLFWMTPPTSGGLERAWAIEDQFGLRFWDAMLIASANEAGCAIFLSEDLNDGQVYGRVRVVDPFRHAPDAVLGDALRS